MPDVYKTKSGDTWDVVSLAAYGSEMFVDDLMTANWEQRTVAVFSAGVTLTLPDVSFDKLAASNAPPWRQTNGGA